MKAPRKSDHRDIVCPHGAKCEIRFTTEVADGGFHVSIDGVGCPDCASKLCGPRGVASEWGNLLVRNHITPALKKGAALSPQNRQDDSP